MTERNPNAYYDRLGIDPPSPEDLLDSRDLKLFEMVVIVLLENGGPMSLEDLCDRIDADASEWTPSKRDIGSRFAIRSLRPGLLSSCCVDSG